MTGRSEGLYFKPGLSKVELSRHCLRGSRIAPTAERARLAAGPQEERRTKEAAAGSELKGTPWRLGACCSEYAWSGGCMETAWSL